MQNQMNYNPAYGYGYNMPQMHNYAQPAFKTPNNQPITFEEQEHLRSRQHKIEMTLNQNEVLAGRCTHRDVRSGEIAYTIDSNGKCRCAICGATWEMVEQDIKWITAAIDNVANIIQTIKCMYHDIPASVIDEVLAPMLCLLERLKALWVAALEDFKKYEDMNLNTVNPMSLFGGGNAFNQYQSIATFASYPQYNAQMQPFNPQMNQAYPQMSMAPNGYVQQPMNQQMVPQTAPQFNNTQVVAPQGGYFGSMMPNNPIMYTDGNPTAPAAMPVGYGNVPAAPAPMFNNAPAVGAMPDVNNAPAAPAVATTTSADSVQQHKTYNI